MKFLLVLQLKKSRIDLKVHHEGTNGVREIKMNRLVGNYEMFRVKPRENITQMQVRYVDIVNGLASQGKIPHTP